MSEQTLHDALTRLEAELSALGSVLVAFSGGADSALLLAAAARVLPAGSVRAATAVSGSLASGELDGARAFAADRGVGWLEVPTDEMSRDGYRANAADRCFHCKSELLDRLRPLAAAHGLAHVVTGTNADDAVAGFRPGIRAAAERGARTPLLDAGLTKAQVREASRLWGLPTWNKPAAACLSSRIAYGIRITPAALTRVDRAEQELRETLRRLQLPSPDLRVRDMGGDRARIELDPRLVGTLGRADAGRLCAAVRGTGFEQATIDPRGFRSGSMNELLAEPERFR